MRLQLTYNKAIAGRLVKKIYSLVATGLKKKF